MTIVLGYLSDRFLGVVVVDIAAMNGDSHFKITEPPINSAFTAIRRVNDNHVFFVIDTHRTAIVADSSAYFNRFLLNLDWVIIFET